MQETMFGLIKRLILENGDIIKCVEKEKWFGKMEEAIKASIQQTKCMGLEFFNGLTGGDTKAIGNKANNMEKETIF